MTRLDRLRQVRIVQAEREAGLNELARLGQEFDAHDG